MIYSFILTGLILAIAVFFGLSQKEQLTELRTEWQTLREKGSSYDIPEDPSADYAATRLGQHQDKMIRPAEVEAFSVELIAFMKEMKEAQRSGNNNELENQKRGMELFMRLTEFSGSEIKHFVDHIIADSSLKNETKNEMVMMSVMMLSQEEPRTALAIIIETKGKILKNTQMSDHFIGIAVGQLATEDPLEALQWMKDHKDELGTISDDLRSQVLQSAAKEDLKNAFSLMSDIKFENDSSALYAISQSVDRENIGDFMEGIRSISGDKEKTIGALITIHHSPLWDDAEDAISWLDEATFQEDEKETIVTNLQYDSIEGDPATWLDWLGTQDDISATPQISSNIIRQWTRRDFKAAGEWVNTLDVGPQKENAVHAYAKTLLEHEHRAAREWANNLQESEKKSTLLQQISEKLESAE